MMKRSGVFTSTGSALLLAVGIIIVPAAFAFRKPALATSSSSSLLRQVDKLFGQQSADDAGTGVPTKQRRRRLVDGVLDRVINDLFSSADMNQDGTIDFDEVYVVVLKTLVKVNQYAPVPTPSRETVHQMFDNVDTKRSGKLNIEEFQQLMWIILDRHSTRILAYKISSAVLAPIFALQLTNRLKGNTFLLGLLDRINLPDDTREKVCQVQTWQAILTTISVSTFGSVAMAAANALVNFKLSRSPPGDSDESDN